MSIKYNFKKIAEGMWIESKDKNGKKNVPHWWANHVKRKGSSTIGEVLHHSLNEDGQIASYDVKWPDGTIDHSVPSAILEELEVEMQEHETDTDEKN